MAAEAEGSVDGFEGGEKALCLFDKHRHNTRSMSRVAILATPRSVTIYDAPTKEDKTDGLEGTYSVLVEGGII